MKLEIDLVELAKAVLHPRTVARIAELGDRARDELGELAAGLETAARAAPVLAQVAAALRRASAPKDT
ncbi:MAG: hypothetical protein Q8Q14_05260 [Gemmatimonadales bacterium]|nr:hypothetical protein [Gemmatimonadales bacterium]